MAEKSPILVRYGNVETANFFAQSLNLALKVSDVQPALVHEHEGVGGGLLNSLDQQGQPHHVQVRDRFEAVEGVCVQPVLCLETVE